MQLDDYVNELLGKLCGGREPRPYIDEETGAVAWEYQLTLASGCRHKLFHELPRKGFYSHCVRVPDPTAELIQYLDRPGRLWEWTLCAVEFCFYLRCQDPQAMVELLDATVYLRWQRGELLFPSEWGWKCYKDNPRRCRTKANGIYVNPENPREAKFEVLLKSRFFRQQGIQGLSGLLQARPIDTLRYNSFRYFDFDRLLCTHRVRRASEAERERVVAEVAERLARPGGGLAHALLYVRRELGFRNAAARFAATAHEIDGLIRAAVRREESFFTPTAQAAAA